MKIVHVNREYIAFNAKHGDILPVYTMKRGKNGKAVYAFGVKFKGESELIDPREHEQLKCGARAWVQTDGEVDLIDPMSFEDTQKLKRSVEKV